MLIYWKLHLPLSILLETINLNRRVNEDRLMDLKIQMVKMKKRTQQSSDGITTSASELMAWNLKNYFSCDIKGKLGSK